MAKVEGGVEVEVPRSGGLSPRSPRGFQSRSRRSPLKGKTAGSAVLLPTRAATQTVAEPAIKQMVTNVGGSQVMESRVRGSPKPRIPENGKFWRA